MRGVDATRCALSAGARQERSGSRTWKPLRLMALSTGAESPIASNVPAGARQATVSVKERANRREGRATWPAEARGASRRRGPGLPFLCFPAIATVPSPPPPCPPDVEASPPRSMARESLFASAAERRAQQSCSHEPRATIME